MLVAARPGAVVLVAQIVGAGAGRADAAERIRALDATVVAVVAARPEAGERLAVVDMRGVSVAGFSDGMHPGDER